MHITHHTYTYIMSHSAQLALKAIPENLSTPLIENMYKIYMKRKVLGNYKCCIEAIRI